MSDSLDDLRDASCVARVEESDIPGVDYVVIAKDVVTKQDLRYLWLSKHRDSFKWVGECEHSVETAFALLKEK